MSQNLLVKLKGTEQGSAQAVGAGTPQEECRGIARLCKDEIRKGKVQMELNLAKYAKGNKMDFCRCVSQKGKVRECVLLG